MATTAQDLINTALRKIGAISSGDSASTTETADALLDLNGLVDSLNADRLYIFSIQPTLINLIPGQSAYSLARPERIENANIVDLTNPSQPVRTPVRVAETADEWAAISVRAVPTPLPSLVYCDGAYPTSSLLLWGVPSAANQLELFLWQTLTAFATAATSVSFPAGYYELLWSELAIRVASDYGREIPASVMRVNEDARRRVESINSVTPRMSVDSALLRSSERGRGVWNWITNR